MNDQLVIVNPAPDVKAFHAYSCAGLNSTYRPDATEQRIIPHLHIH